MSKVIEAIYQRGVIKPLQKLKIPQNERLRITITPLSNKSMKKQHSLCGIFPELSKLREEDFKEAKNIWEEKI